MEVNWANLPGEILGEIMNRLVMSDIDSCKYVCKPWFWAIREAVDLRSLSPIPSPPWLLIPAAAAASYYNPVDKRVYYNNNNINSWRPPPPQEASCVGSSHGWLAFIDPNCTIYLVNPLVPESSTRLPPIETLPCILSSSLSPEGGDLEFVYWNSYSGNTRVERAKDYLYAWFVTKLVMSSAPSEEDCMAMMIYGEQFHLAICKIGATSWTKLNGKIEPHGEIYYSTSQKLLYALELESFSFEAWDLNDFSHPKFTFIDRYIDIPFMHPSLSVSVEEQTLRSRCKQHLSLGELYGNLLLIVRHFAFAVDKDGHIVDSVEEDEEDQVVDNNEEGQIIDNFEEDQIIDNIGQEHGFHIRMDYEYTLPHKTFRFDAYEFDWVKQQWVNVKSLGVKSDGVLFLGSNNSMDFSTSDFPRLQANSVYFADTCRSYFSDVAICNRSFGGHDIGIFNFNNNEIDPCYYSWDNMKITPVAPVWISPKSTLI